jgi:Tfp pilus assembly PilM family ATPase
MSSGNFFSHINRFFPTPRYLTFDPVAIDILPTSIRLMKLKHDKFGLIPDFYKEIKLKTPIDITQINNEKEINTTAFKEVLDILKKLKKDYKLKYVVSSLPEGKTYIFRTRLPKESSGSIASAILFSLEENVPLPAKDVNFDYFVLDDSEEGVDVVVNVFPKNIIRIYTNLFKRSGLYPISYQAESTAFADAVVNKKDENPYLLIRLLEERIGIAIVEDGIVQYASTISVSAKDVVENYDSDAAAELSEALNKVLIFWFTSKKDPISHEKIQTALITGEYSTHAGIQEFLERHLKINVEVGNVWSNCFSTKEYIPLLGQKESLNFSVAVGLALRAIKHA